MKMQFSLPAAVELVVVVSNSVLATAETRLLHSIADAIPNLYE